VQQNQLQNGNIQQALPLFDRAIQVAEAIPDRAAQIRALSAIALKLADMAEVEPV
jgi:hypothetical protein